MQSRPVKCSTCIRKYDLAQAGPSYHNNEWNCLSCRSPTLIELPRGANYHCWNCLQSNSRLLRCSTCVRYYHRYCAKPQYTGKNWICSLCLAPPRMAPPLNSSRSPAEQKITRCLMYAFDAVYFSVAKSHHMSLLMLENWNTYKQLVTHHVDLTCIWSKLLGERYSCTNAMLADYLLLFTNMNLLPGNQQRQTIANELYGAMRIQCTIIEQCIDCYIASKERPITAFQDTCTNPHLLVWGARNGRRYWPAKVIRVSQDAMVEVQYFGTMTTFVIHEHHCLLFSQLNPNKGAIKSSEWFVSYRQAEQHVVNLVYRFGCFSYAEPDRRLKASEANQMLRRMLPDAYMNGSVPPFVPVVPVLPVTPPDPAMLQKLTFGANVDRVQPGQKRQRPRSPCMDISQQDLEAAGSSTGRNAAQPPTNLMSQQSLSQLQQVSPAPVALDNQSAPSAKRLARALLTPPSPAALAGPQNPPENPSGSEAPYDLTVPITPSGTTDTRQGRSLLTPQPPAAPENPPDLEGPQAMLPPAGPQNPPESPSGSEAPYDLTVPIIPSGTTDTRQGRSLLTPQPPAAPENPPDLEGPQAMLPPAGPQNPPESPSGSDAPSDPEAPDTPELPEAPEAPGDPNQPEGVSQLVPTQQASVQRPEHRLTHREYLQRLLKIINRHQAEMASLKAEHARQMHTYKMQQNKDQMFLIYDIKSKIHCTRCHEEAIMMCCWPIAYCSRACLLNHWHLHKKDCRKAHLLNPNVVFELSLRDCHQRRTVPVNSTYRQRSDILSHSGIAQGTWASPPSYRNPGAQMNHLYAPSTSTTSVPPNAEELSNSVRSYFMPSGAPQMVAGAPTGAPSYLAANMPSLTSIRQHLSGPQGLPRPEPIRPQPSLARPAETVTTSHGGSEHVGPYRNGGTAENSILLPWKQQHQQ